MVTIDTIALAFLKFISPSPHSVSWVTTSSPSGK
jgi:hypothetical protein